MIRLTEEEMDREYCLADLHADKFAHKAIANAQLKKGMEYIVQNKDDLFYASYDGAVVGTDAWQALLKEVVK